MRKNPLKEYAQVYTPTVPTTCRSIGLLQFALFLCVLVFCSLVYDGLTAPDLQYHTDYIRIGDPVIFIVPDPDLIYFKIILTQRELFISDKKVNTIEGIKY